MYQAHLVNNLIFHTIKTPMKIFPIKYDTSGSGFWNNLSSCFCAKLLFLTFTVSHDKTNDSF